MGVVMWGADEASSALFSYVDLDERIPARHSLRLIRRIVNGTFASLNTDLGALLVDFARSAITLARLWPAF